MTRHPETGRVGPKPDNTAGLPMFVVENESAAFPSGGINPGPANKARARMKAQSKASSVRQRICIALEAYDGGLTRSELSGLLAVSLNTINPRVHELLEAGLVHIRSSRNGEGIVFRGAA